MKNLQEIVNEAVNEVFNGKEQENKDKNGWFAPFLQLHNRHSGDENQIYYAGWYNIDL